MDIVKKTLSVMGNDRVLFATDGIFEEGVGKTLDASLSDEQMKKLFHDNFANILKMGA
jgi:predicted TIM-barrel fold metal-dependent hydrolase